MHFKLGNKSLNQGAATASSEPILKAAHLIAIFKRKMSVVSRKQLGNTHRLGDSIHLLLPLSLWCFRLTTDIFLLKIHILLAALVVVVALAVASAVAVAAFID